MRFFWQHFQSRLLPVGIILLIAGKCTFPPPDPWSLPIRTIQLPAHGEVGQVLLPYLLERPDSLRITCPPQIQVAIDLDRDTLIIRSLDDDPGNYLLTLSTGRRNATLAVRVTPRFPIDFYYQSDTGSMHQVKVVGSFTGWTKNPLSLLDLDQDGNYRATAYLTPQRHEYSLVVNGEWLPDPARRNRVPSPAGRTTSILDLRDSTATAVGFFIRTGHTGRHFLFRYTQPLGAEYVDPGSIVVLVDNLKLPRQQWTFNESNGELQISFHFKTQGFVRILAQDQKGNVCRETQFLLENGKSISASTPLDSWYTRTVYFPLTDRFYDGDPYDNWSLSDPDVPPIANHFGGDLEGIRYKLEEGYFDSLGISALLISPLNQGPDSAYASDLLPQFKQTGYHGYWPVHPTRVDQRIGGHPAALELVGTAHDHGLKVILDFVAHHTHRLHPYFKDHQIWYKEQIPDLRDDPHLPYHQDLSLRPETFLSILDYNNSTEALEAMTDDAISWIDTYEFDGFHHFASDKVSNRFWTTLTRKLQEYFPGKTMYQLGQAHVHNSHPDQIVNSIQLDGQVNFDLYYMTREAFALGSGAMTDIAWNLEHNVSIYEPMNLMGTLASSYDLARFISLVDQKVSFGADPTNAAWERPPTPAGMEAHERLRLYYTFLLTLPGVPILYYGDEIGMAGAGDPDNRRPMKWSNWSDDEQTTFHALSRLIHLRRDHPALAVGDLVITSASEDVLAYHRVGFEEEFLVVLNKSNAEQTYVVPGSNDIIWRSKYGGTDTILSDTEQKIPPRSGRIFQAMMEGDN